jgi:leucyl aminopeptidase
MKVSFSSDRLLSAGFLVLAVTEGPHWGKTGKSLNKKSDGLLDAASEKNRFKGKKGETLTLISPAGLGIDRLVLVGLGEGKEMNPQRMAEAGGNAAAVIPQHLADEVTIALDLGKDAALPEGRVAAEFAQGFALRSYRFDKYFTKTPKDKLPVLKKLSVITDETKDAQKAWKRLEAITAGVTLARNLVSEPANVIYPESYARECQKLKDLGVKVEVLDVKAMTALGMGSLLGVAQGSVRPARLVTMHYKGDVSAKAKHPFALVGKGVTFDTGGISIKPSGGMEDMKYDMAGSAAVVGAIHALAARKAKVNVVGVIGLVENMPDGNAQRPGDVVTSMSGQTIEVINTDAEGRLVLCDLLTYTQDKFKPRAMVNLATLTGAIVLALGAEHAGLFCNDDKLADQLLAAGLATEEKLWRFPMNEAYDRQLNSDIADMKNASNERVAGSIFGAQFLARFVDKNTPWAHLDIAGMAWARRDLPLVPKGATAYGVRLLEQLIADHYEG